MPAVVKSTDGSSGISEDEGTTACPRAAKNSRNFLRISEDSIHIHHTQSIREIQPLDKSPIFLFTGNSSSRHISPGHFQGAKEMSPYKAIPKEAPVKYCACGNKLNTHNEEDICNACIVKRRFDPAPTDPPRQKYNRTRKYNKTKVSTV